MELGLHVSCRYPFFISERRIDEYTLLFIVLDQPAKLGRILIGMNRALGEIPLTLKVRTGVKDGRNTAHKLMPRIGSEWGAGAITVRTRIALFY